ncbi:PA2778 family cysteine peptidase [Sinimarinibacterium thermocellulolyticum]|uniref:PA2778 family cysteine peptidase n=1 Tax=Sinimarinibacterium thermocellulolyticum TaxID=3170016 RepID=A0ABV2A9X3_9GAMM
MAPPPRRWRAPGLLMVALMIGACAGPETLRLRAESVPVELAAVPFHPQDEYHCGPAALATVLAADGVDVSPEALVPEIYVPARQGSLQAEIIAAVRRRARVPFVLAPHIDAALAELHAGRPVLVLQNLGTRGLPVWHYAVVVGFDPRQQRFVLRSGRERRLEMSARRFLQSWDRAGRWMLVVARPDAPPVSAEVQSWLRAVAAFESLGELKIAITAYRAATRRWPAVPMTWTALGNGLAQRGLWASAARAYERALTSGGDTPWLRNNHAWVLAQMGCRADALAEIDAALTAAVEPAQRDTLRDTRARIETLQPDAVCDR